MAINEDEIVSQLRKFGLPLKKYNKFPTIKKWQERAGGDFTSAEWSNATGYGVNCGHAGIVVIDIDTKSVDGYATWQELVHDEDNPDTLTVATANGGEHRYYRLPKGYDLAEKTIRNSVERVLGPGIDVRAKGGQVVGPGSTVWLDKDDHSKGKGTYTVRNAAKIALIPAWLLARLTQDAPAPVSPATYVAETRDDCPDAYARKALDGAALEVMRAPQGRRNDTLNREAFGAAKAGAPVPLVVDELTRAALTYGDWPEVDLRTTIARSALDGSAHYVPRPQSGPAPRTDAASSVTASASSVETVPVGQDPFHDTPLAQRFTAERADLRFVSEWKQWIAYRPALGIYEPLPDEELHGIVRDWLQAEYLEACSTADVNRIRKASRCLSNATVSSVEKLCRPDLLISSADLDAHHDLVVVANGLLDLRSKTLSPFNPGLFMTKRISIAYVPGATSWVFDKVLETLPDDAREWVQLMAGQALTGYQTASDVCVFLLGDGENGKTAFVNSMSATAGDYGGMPMQDTLLMSGGDTTGLIGFKGLRQAIIEELPDNRHLDVGAIKRLVGTGPLTARALYRQPETFTLQASVWITCNRLPSVTETDHGTWRRLLVLPFPYTFVKNAADVVSGESKLADLRVKPLSKTDQQALEAALAWRVEGAYRWFQDPQDEARLPQSVVDATGKWRGRSDNVLGWMDDALIFDPAYFALTEDLRDSFNYWLKTHGYQALGQKTFLERLEQHSGFKANRLELKRGRTGQHVHSPWTQPGEYGNARKPGVTPTHVKGLRFRTSADDEQEMAAEVAIPDDASELVDHLDLTDDNELFDDETLY